MALASALSGAASGAGAGASFGPWGAVVGGGLGLVGGLFSSNAQEQAIEEASRLQQESITLAIEDARRQYGENSQQFQQFKAQAEEALAPYRQTGAMALEQQRDLAGLNGPEKQQAAQAAIAGGVEMAGLTKEGENAILQQASATGGLRGGNVQGALAQFRPQLLRQLIEQQYNRLGGFVGVGQNAVQQQLALPWQGPQLNLGDLLLGGGRVGAGAALAGGQADVGRYAGLAQFGGQMAGLDWGKILGSAPPSGLQSNLNSVEIGGGYGA